MRNRLTFVSAIAILSTGAYAQSLSSISVAGTIGVYYPSNSQIRNLFGSQLISYGVTPWTGNSTRGGFSPEIGLINGNSNGNSFLLIPVALAYEKDFTSTADSTGVRRTSVPFVPYLRASAGVAYFDYDITTAPGVNYSLRRLGSTAGLEGGLKISNSAKVFVKYDLFSVEQGFNFSGLQIGLELSLFKL